MKLSRSGQWLLPLLATVLASCGGSGGSASGGETPGNNDVVNQSVSIVAPVQYPDSNSLAQVVPVLIYNNGTTDVTSPSFNIANNTTQAQLSIESSQCATIPAGGSCQLNISAAGGHSGSFRVVSGSSYATVGFVDASSSQAIGINGVTALYPAAVTLNSTGTTTPMIMSLYVNSKNAGNFNAITLNDINGNPLSYKTLSANNCTTCSNLKYGDVVTLEIDLPNTSDMYQFTLQPQLNGKNVYAPTGINTIFLRSGVAVLQMQPSVVKLIPSSPTQTITVRNNGNGPASNMSIVAGTASSTSPLTISNNTCGTTLNVESSCSYTVGYDSSQPQRGTSSVTLNYNYSASKAALPLTSTVQYTGLVASHGLKIVNNNNPNFAYTSTTANPTQTDTVTLTNTGTSRESNISIMVPSPRIFSLSNAGVTTNPCPAASNFALESGASCNLKLTYNNTSATSGANAFLVTYNYLGLNNVSSSDAISFMATWNTKKSQAILNLSQTSYNFGSIYNNGTSSATQTFTLTNNGDESAMFSMNSLSLESSVKIASTTCASSLSAGSSCTITLKFGPTTRAATTISTALNIVYNSISDTTTSSALSLALAGQVNVAGNAALGVALVANSGFAGGTGTSASPFMFQVNNTPQPTVTYRITNSGVGPAQSLSITNSIPSTWTQSSNGCSGTLAAGGTCDIVYKLTTTSSVGSNNITPTITATYTNSGSSSSTSTSLTGTTAYVTLFAAPTVTLSTTSTTLGPGQSSTVTATLNGGYNVTSQTVTIAGDSSVTGGSCILSSASPTCTITISVSSSATAGNHVVSATTSGTSGATMNSANITVVIANPTITISQTTSAYIGQNGAFTVTMSNVLATRTITVAGSGTSIASGSCTVTPSAPTCTILNAVQASAVGGTSYTLGVSVNGPANLSTTSVTLTVTASPIVRFMVVNNGNVKIFPSAYFGLVPGGRTATISASLSGYLPNNSTITAGLTISSPNAALSASNISCQLSNANTYCTMQLRALASTGVSLSFATLSPYIQSPGEAITLTKVIDVGTSNARILPTDGKYMFITNAQYVGKYSLYVTNGTAGNNAGDTICQQQAANGIITGAMTGSWGVHNGTHALAANTTYYNTHGDRISVTTTPDPVFPYKPEVTFNYDASDNGYTGYQAQPWFGMIAGPSNYDCQTWTYSSGTVTHYGMYGDVYNLGTTTSSWASVGNADCGSQRPLLCVQK